MIILLIITVELSILSGIQSILILKKGIDNE